MNRRDFVNRLAILPLVGRLARTQGGARAATTDYSISPVSYLEVEVDDPFWTPRIEATRRVALPFFFDYQPEGGRHYHDMRVIEGACYFLAKRPDPALRAWVDGRLDAGIESMRKLKQLKWPMEADGTTLPAGDFLLAAVAYQQATGSRKLMDVAVEIADDLAATFGPGKRSDVASHEGVEFALIRLYRATGDRRYVRLARFLVDQRGNWKRTGRESYGSYAQDQEPLVEQTRAIGHCVRATYIYNGLTDVAGLTGEPIYADAAHRIWADAVSKRTYLTGGIGSYRHHENYGDDYDLPNLGCWNEICAACGNVWWNHRLFLLNGEARHLDVMERTLYNGMLPGVSLGGDRHFYQTPLKAYGNFQREKWFGPECCPPNLTRLLASLGDLIYARGDRGVYVNLFIGSKARFNMNGTSVRLQQETRYPWEGTTTLTVSPETARRFSVLLRIPGWSRDEVMPGGLYRYTGAGESGFTLEVNGQPADYVLEKGFARIDRDWAKGDVLELRLKIPVKKVRAREEVLDDRGRVALERGPLVFCAEGADNLGRVFNLQVPEDANFDYVYRKDLLGGVGTITGRVHAWSRGEEGKSVQSHEQAFTAVPYYAFGNRGPGEMAVWLAAERSRVELPPTPTLASTSRATSSCASGTVADNYPGHTPPAPAKRWYPNAQDGSGDLRALHDQIEPVNSEDESSYFLRLRPQSGAAAWVQYDFTKPARVGSVEVYWKDDKQYCPAPQSWRLLFKDGEDWKPVAPRGAYGVERDKFNRLDFEPVTTSGLRLEIRLQGKTFKKGGLGPPDANWMNEDLVWYEGGIIEWKVNEA